LTVQFACQFSIFVCVARIFDRHPSGTLEAGKLRARIRSVKSRVSPQRLPSYHGQIRSEISSRVLFLFSS
jgi:hypothetical protein